MARRSRSRISLGLIAGGVAVAGAVVLTSPPLRAGGVALDRTAHAGAGVLLGTRWGCAEVGAEAGSAWECWEARAPAGAGGGAGGAALAAWRVPWLGRRRLVGGPDRICTLERDSGLRCWQPPRRGETEPRPWHRPGPPSAPPRGRPAGNTTKPAAVESYLDFDYLLEGMVGGTFACPTRRMDVWCAGDDSYGQLGTGDAPAKDPPLLGLANVSNTAFGYWHACVSNEDYRGDPRVFCWGRGDAGQLGFPPPDTCRVGNRGVPCARRPERVPTALQVRGLTLAPGKGLGAMRAGDLFTCAHQSGGVYCWGASRDGFFGDPAACPGGLKQAWPT